MPLLRSRNFRELAISVSEYRPDCPDVGQRRPDSARTKGFSNQPGRGSSEGIVGRGSSAEGIVGRGSSGGDRRRRGSLVTWPISRSWGRVRRCSVDPLWTDSLARDISIPGEGSDKTLSESKRYRFVPLDHRRSPLEP